MTARRPKTKTPNSNPTGRLPAADSQKKLSYNRTTIWPHNPFSRTTKKLFYGRCSQFSKDGIFFSKIQKKSCPRRASFLSFIKLKKT